MDLKGKTGIVTGAARGIGRAIALKMFQEGMNVVVADLEKSLLDQWVKETEGAHNRILTTMADVTSPVDAERMAQTAIEQWGTIHALVNNAGVIKAIPFIETTQDEWEKIISVNLGGVFHCCKAVVSHMIENRAGRIVNISSVAGKKAAPLISAYSASKFGVIGLTQALALELGSHDITVNAVCPGFIETSMWKDHLNPALSPVMGVDQEAVLSSFAQANVALKRPQTPEDIAQCVIFLLKADNVSGVAVNVDGGHTMI